MLMLARQWSRLSIGHQTIYQKGVSLVAWSLVCIGVVGWWIGAAGLFFVIAFPIFATIVYGFALRRYRMIENQSVATIIVAGMEKGISPLETAVACAQEATGAQQVKTEKMASQLSAGASLTTAARVSSIHFPLETRMLLVLEEYFPGFQRTSLDRRGGHRGESNDATKGIDIMLGGIGMLLVILLMVGPVIAFLHFRIRPTLEMIAKEFSVTGKILDRADPWVWQFGEWFSLLMIPLCAIFLPILLLSFILLAIVQMGWLTELPWGLRWIHGPLNECRLLRIMAHVAAGSIPLTSAFEVLQQWYPTGRIRKSLRRVRERVSQGEPWAVALQRAGVFSRNDVALAQAAETAGNLPWALSEIADGQERRHMQRIGPWMKLFVPFLIFFAAVPVLMASMALFVVLSEFVRGVIE